jgi:hypothetical protein
MQEQLLDVFLIQPKLKILPICKKEGSSILDILPLCVIICLYNDVTLTLFLYTYLCLQLSVFTVISSGNRKVGEYYFHWLPVYLI